MKMIVTRIMVAAASASMMIAPAAANANTRAGDSAAMFLAPTSVQIISDDVDEAGAWLWEDYLIGLVYASVAVALILALDGSNDQSPGT